MRLSRLYTPEITDDYKGSYTKNAINTTRYMEIVLDSNFQNKWIVSLDHFFINKLNLSDESITRFSLAETALFRRLRDERSKLTTQNSTETIKNMMKQEKIYVIRMRKVIKEDIDYDKFLKFEKSFFLKYRKITPTKEE